MLLTFHKEILGVSHRELGMADRLMVFSSKAGNGLFNRPYIAYIDEDGRSSKAFVLPQRDPDFYQSHTKLYQLPELIKEPIPLKGERLAKVIRSDQWLRDELPVTSATWQAPRAEADTHIWCPGG